MFATQYPLAPCLLIASMVCLSGCQTKPAELPPTVTSHADREAEETFAKIGVGNWEREDGKGSLKILPDHTFEIRGPDALVTGTCKPNRTGASLIFRDFPEAVSQMSVSDGSTLLLTTVGKPGMGTVKYKKA